MERIIQKSEREGRRERVRKQKDEWSRGSACEMGVQRSGNRAALIVRAFVCQQHQAACTEITDFREGPVPLSPVITAEHVNFI